jgi:hypothetical protein
MEYLATSLGCGIHEASFKDNQGGKFVVSKLSDLTGKIIHFYDKYPILDCNSKDFSDFKQDSNLIKKKAHFVATLWLLPFRATPPPP